MPINEASLLIQIEQFIDQVVDNPNEWDEFRGLLEELIHNFKIIYNPAYLYFGCINLFIEQAKGLTHHYLEYFVETISYALFRRQCENYLKQHNQQLKKLKDQEKYNLGELDKYIQLVIGHYSKLLFVRVDLCYLKEHQSEINIQVFNNNMKKLLLRMKDRDACFKNLQGYAWALEQGVEKGYHTHLLLIYDGSKRQNDWWLADQVGTIWQEITEKQGYSFNCNMPAYKEEFSRRGMLGIGMIHRDDNQQVSNCLNTCRYLVNPEKEDQHLRVKLSGMRTFSKSIYATSKRRYRA